MFKPLLTQSITDNIYAVNSIICNFYVYDTGKSLLVFDTGINPLWSGTKLRKLHLQADKVSHVFLTHSDYDHMGGVRLFKNAKILISDKEEPMVTRKKARILFKYNHRLKDYQTMEDRESITVDGTTIQIISAPGHTPGSACYLINQEVLITGDSISLSGKGVIGSFFFVQNMDHSGSGTTVNRLENEGIFNNAKLILTGHYGYKNNKQ